MFNELEHMCIEVKNYEPPPNQLDFTYVPTVASIISKNLTMTSKSSTVIVDVLLIDVPLPGFENLPAEIWFNNRFFYQPLPHEITTQEMIQSFKCIRLSIPCRGDLSNFERDKSAVKI